MRLSSQCQVGVDFLIEWSDFQRISLSHKSHRRETRPPPVDTFVQNPERTNTSIVCTIFHSFCYSGSWMKILSATQLKEKKNFSFSYFLLSAHEHPLSTALELCTKMFWLCGRVKNIFPLGSNSTVCSVWGKALSWWILNDNWYAAYWNGRFVFEFE